MLEVMTQLSKTVLRKGRGLRRVDLGRLGMDGVSCWGDLGVADDPGKLRSLLRNQVISFCAGC